jgi:hypothetical protein
MNKILKEKINEALSSVLPITAIVLILSITITPLPIGTLMLFLTGAVLLIIGMGFFTLGADISMMPMGEGIGAEMTKTKNLSLVIFICILMGILITIAEPDLQVLANQVPAIPNKVLILTVAIGVGIFLVIAMLRTLYKIKLSHMLIFFYLIAFILAMFVPDNFIPVSFDSGGVTTGPITVPFIMALGLGLASIRSDKDSHDDSFGLVALCSVGPILAVLLLGIVYNPSSATYSSAEIPEILTSRDVAKEFAIGLPHYFQEVFIALVPIILFFTLFQFKFKRYRKHQLLKITVGFLYTFIGLVLFLTGVNVGFLPVGQFLGSEIAASPYKWLLIPLGMLIGYFIVAAEPAVHVLNKQVEDISSGAIPQSAMQISLSIGVAISVGLAMTRVLTGISIYWFLIPGYIIAIGLTFLVPRIFTGIAFDSGGVASGPMTATFLLPFAMGACESLGGNILTDAFGAVAMVAMTPLITIQMLGLIYKRKMKVTTGLEPIDIMGLEDEIIQYEEEIPNE